MAKYRVTFPNSEPVEHEADYCVSNGNGVRLYRADKDSKDGAVREVAYYTSGSFTSCAEVPSK